MEASSMDRFAEIFSGRVTGAVRDSSLNLEAIQWSRHCEATASTA